MPTHIQCQFASLNANSIIKTNNPQTQKSYIRYLRSLNFDILCLQESHTSTDEKINSAKMHFQYETAFWTPHVGIISFSPKYQLHLVDTSDTFNSSRYQLCRVTHPHKAFVDFFILNVYAPAQPARERRLFFDRLYQMLQQLNTNSIDLNRLIIAGDFNYSLARSDTLSSATSADWLVYLECNFTNIMTLSEEVSDVPTFYRETVNGGIWSSIDYIYASEALRNFFSNSQITRLHHTWSDHSILSTYINVGPSPTGPGLWRGNPAYATHARLQQQLARQLTSYVSSLEAETLTAAAKWDLIKLKSKKVIRKYSYTYDSWRETKIRQLQTERNRILRSSVDPLIRGQLIPPIDTALNQLQEEIAETHALKAGQRWREHGEKSAGFLKRLHTKRTTEQYINRLQPLGNDGYPNTAEVTSDPNNMRDITQHFYENLYNTDAIDDDSLDRFLASINFSNSKVSDIDNQMLDEVISSDDIAEQLSRCRSKTSSPGDHGLGYQFLQVLYDIPVVRAIIVQVFNDALHHQIFPTSWAEIRVRLLPKKGDLTSLKNWRPISLINCDAKVFTRILNSRLSSVIGKIIQPYQTGFMPGRFIGDNGLLLHFILQQARIKQHPGIGLLLDQEKAYDRVHPAYLRKVLTKFHLSTVFIDCIMSLFFGNNIQVNVNGFFSPNITQKRGLRQGDPLSPLLFNLALEPLLLLIQQDTRIQGFEYTTVDNQPTSIKLLAYADDVCTLLHTPSDFQLLQKHLDWYAAVSNAKFNTAKTEVFTLAGKPLNDTWREALIPHQITTSHDSTSPKGFRYLGFTMVYTVAQRKAAEQALLQKVQDTIHLYSTRQLSLRGRTTVLNTLILSKIWYTIRILNPTQRFFTQLKSMVYQYVWQKKYPLVSYALLCSPPSGGGIGLIDPASQHLVLQYKYLSQIFTLRSDSSNIAVNFLLSALQDETPNVRSFPTITFFVPEYRSNDRLNHPTSMLSVLYRAFDHFQVQYKFDQLPVHTLLQLPLQYLFTKIPPKHWLSTHKKIPASALFHYDTSNKKLQLRPPNTYQVFPRLLHQLSEIITMIANNPTTISTQWWHMITDHFSEDSPILSAKILTQQLLASPLWSRFVPSVFRSLHQSPSIEQYSICQIPAVYLQYRFWGTPMLLPARDLWYRVLCNKLPTGEYLHTINRRESPTCILCSYVADNFLHFLVACPRKFAVWQNALGSFLPWLTFSPDMIFLTLRSLIIPSTIPRSLQRPYLILVSTIQFLLWKGYWRLIFDNIPFDPEHVLSDIHTTFRVLLK